MPFDKRRLMEFLKVVDEELNKPIELTAVGGTAMTLLDLKDSTVDMDFNLEERHIRIQEGAGYPTAWIQNRCVHQRINIQSAAPGRLRGKKNTCGNKLQEHKTIYTASPRHCSHQDREVERSRHRGYKSMYQETEADLRADTFKGHGSRIRGKREEL